MDGWDGGRDMIQGGESSPPAAQRISGETCTDLTGVSDCTDLFVHVIFGATAASAPPIITCPKVREVTDQ